MATLLAFAGSGPTPVRAADDLPDHEPTIDDIIRARPGEDRIVGGTRAKSGQWPSMVAIFVRGTNGRSMNFCGGSMIGDGWVLTAAHCAAAMKQMPPQARFFIREGRIKLRGNLPSDIGVTDIVPHPDYDPKRTLNDVALLKLARRGQAPLQKLLGNDGYPTVMVPEQRATVIGFGKIAEEGAVSPDLLQTDVPILSQPKCAQIYGSDRITDRNFCAGWEKGGRDACQGDSGGPIFRPGPSGEELQVGVVSWGKGCGGAGFPGVYASVGAFQDWVKKRVPDANFVSIRSLSLGKPVLHDTQQAVNGLTDGAQTSETPSALAQVTVDLVQGAKVKVGSFVDIRVLSSVSGSLALFNQDSDGRAYQIFPSKSMPSGQGDGSSARIVAGETVSIPPPRLIDQGYRFRIKPPVGDNKLIAMVLPERAEVKDVLSRYADGSDIPDLRGLIDELVNREEGSRGIEAVRLKAPTDRAVAERAYEIVE